MVSSPIQLIRPNRSIRPFVERLTDGIAIGGSIAAMSWWNLGTVSATSLSTAGSCWAVFLLMGELTGLYRDWRGARSEQSWGRALLTWALTLAIFSLGRFAIQEVAHTAVSIGFASWMVVAPAALVAGRAMMHGLLQELYRHGWHTRPCAVFGINSLGVQIAENLRRNPEHGMTLTGFYDDRPSDRTNTIPEELGTRRGGLEQLVQDARDGLVQVVYITLPMRAESRIQRDLLDQLADTTASVYIVPDFLVFELLHGRWTDVGGLPAVSIFESPVYGVDGMLKRALDLVGAIVALAILGLPMVCIALAVKLTSPGPVFFRQRRYGLDGREVYVWKFRSMSVCEDGTAVKQATKGDSRVTPLGRILRKTSLDELPQLFNVLVGNMSLVGPRPHATAHNEQYRKLILGYMLRHKVKPGITGLAQVNGFRGETDTLEKMQGRLELDHEYIRTWSIWLDIKILFKTLWVVWRQPTAY